METAINIPKVSFEDFYEVPNLKFDIERLRFDLEKILEEKKFNSIAKKIRPSSEEILKNKRSRSAIMRVFKKI